MGHDASTEKQNRLVSMREESTKNCINSTTIFYSYIGHTWKTDSQLIKKSRY